MKSLARTLARVQPRAGAAAALLLVIASVAAGCGSPGTTGAPGEGRLNVVTSTTVFADLVRQVAGDTASVHSLVPAGTDVHTFDPKPSDMARVADADLVVMNGLGLDDWVGRIVEDAGTDAPVIELAVDLPGVEYIAGGERDGEAPSAAASDDAHAAEGGLNPHLWLDVALAMKYVERIRGALLEAGADAATVESQAAEYGRRLADLDEEVRQRFATLPADQRRVVSFHDAFPYFARAYGLEVVGVVVDAPGQDPSAGAIAQLIDAIRGADASTILAEAQFPPELVEAIARETGVRVVSDLYTDALGDPPVDTFEGLIRWDAEQISAALSRG